MAKEAMERKASDNEYLHKDFHITLNVGLEFLRENYGPKGVIDYLKTYSKAYYSPVTEGLKYKGLCVLRDHIRKKYDVEKAECKIDFKKDRMIVRIPKSPALEHFKKNNVTPSPMYMYTVKTVYETICEGTPFDFEMSEYDEDTGRCVLNFYRRCS